MSVPLTAQAKHTTAALLTVGLLLAAVPAHAQDTTTYLAPPKGQTDYDQVATPPQVQTDIQYIDETDDRFLEREPIAIPEIRPVRGINLDGLNVAIIVGTVALLLFLLLKYGGAGALLRADPSSGTKPKKRAKGWGLTAAETPAGDILAQIMAMEDRREAMILLLRHCLLQAADETDTYFQRADTEREAMARLPKSWPHLNKLGHIAVQTELVHYGGRNITDDDYTTALDSGRTILRGAK